jgi:predicted DNA-binding transcriptional regulator
MNHESEKEPLTGTTRRVYRYVYRRGPVRLHEIQRDLGLSSSSLADYHVKKLLQMGLIREELGQDIAGGYVAENAIFEEMVRIRRTVVPLWTTTTSFFVVAFIVLITILRPTIISSTYIFSLVIAGASICVSAYEAVRSLGRGP